MDKVKFETTPAEMKAIQRIVARVGKMEGPAIDRMGMMMDLSATHSNGCPLDLDRLAEADDFNLLHDVYGIERHLDRATGQLSGHFRPRFARKDHASLAA